MRDRTELRYNARTERAIEDDITNRKEAMELLDLIDAEFRTDPTSTQCFDLRIVERVRMCVARHQENKKHLPFGG